MMYQKNKMYSFERITNLKSFVMNQLAITEKKNKRRKRNKRIRKQMERKNEEKENKGIKKNKRRKNNTRSEYQAKNNSRRKVILNVMLFKLSIN